ncbi:ADP-ribosylation factor GTPase activating protein, ER-Golgi transport [Globomyces sp. JEL0801]|nr:ADP-ribosylation factor GTPase activating protein, ER-Golgi transport [Globomyces sp. JEL0801]
MGVHITFVRSVQLDSWTIDQLRVMKVGGNGPAQEHLKASAGSFKDAKAKYSSRQMATYKDKLMRLVEDDKRRYPNELVIEGLDSDTPTAAAVADDGDFFSDWDKPAVVSKPTVTTQRSTAFSNPPSSVSSFGFTPSAIAPKPKPVAPPTPASIPISQPLSSTSSAAPIIKKKTGAKKITKAIDFEEAARLAEEESQRIAAHREREALQSKSSRQQPSASGNNSFSSRLAYQEPTTSSTKNDQSPELEQSFKKFGFGFDPTSLDSKPAASSAGVGHKLAGGKVTSKPPLGSGGFGGGFGGVPSQSESSGESAKRFGNAKAISSDEYFQRGQFDAAANAEAREKLQQFSGKSGFGSEDYYGEKDTSVGAQRRQSVENVLYAVQDGASDFAQKFVGQASEDFDSLKKLVTVGGSKLGELLGDIQSRYT